MISHTTERFRSAFQNLPQPVKRRARASYERFRRDPHHPSLQFKQVHAARPVYSVRVGLGYRALGVRKGEVMVWFWIGSHADYDRLLAKGT